MGIRTHFIKIATLAMILLLASCGGGTGGTVTDANFDENIDEDVIITETDDNDDYETEDDENEDEAEDDKDSSKGPLSVTMAIGTKNAVAGKQYAAIFMARGGSGKYSWSATSLPEGLFLSGSKISGIVSTAGSYELAIKASDRENASVTGELVFTLVVKTSEDELPGTGGMDSGNSTMVEIITTSLKDAKYGKEYSSDTLQASGGNGNYKWEIPNLPRGLKIEDGKIKGKPLEIGDFTLNVRASYKDSNSSGHATGTISLKILMRVDVMLIEGTNAKIITNLNTLHLDDNKKIIVAAHALSPKWKILEPSSGIVSLKPVIADGAQELVIDRSEYRHIEKIKIEISDGDTSKEIVTFSNLTASALQTDAETPDDDTIDADIPGPDDEIVSKIKVQILTSGLFKNGDMHVRKSQTPSIKFSLNDKFKDTKIFSTQITDWEMGKGQTLILDVSSKNIKKREIRYFRIENLSDDMWAIGAVKISASTLEDPNTFETTYFNPMSNVVIKKGYASFGPNDRAFFMRTEVADEKNAGDGDDPAYLVLSRSKEAPQSIIDEMKSRDTTSGFSNYLSLFEDYELWINLDRSGDDRGRGEINHYGAYFYNGDPVDGNRWKFSKGGWYASSNYLKLKSLTVMAISPGNEKFLKDDECVVSIVGAEEIGDGKGGLGTAAEILSYPNAGGFCPDKDISTYTETNIKTCFFDDYDTMREFTVCSKLFKSWNDEKNGIGNLAPDDWFD